jgi:bla regulator protein blaR1
VQLRRRVRLMTSTEVASPVAVVYRHPAVIVPPKLLERLEEGECQSVLLHEIAHLARYDDWMALVTLAPGGLLVLHPLSPIVLRQIEREREMACDDFVVARTGSARSYARSLARLHDLRWGAGKRLLAPGILGRHSSLGDRIESLLRRGREFCARPSLGKLGVSGLLLALLLGAGGLIPGWIAIAQTSATLPARFEVASIRPTSPTERLRGWFPTPGRLTVMGMGLRELIGDAYHLDEVQLEGLPGWAKSRKYDIQAVMPPEAAHLPPHQRSQLKFRMLQSLLADRFKLRVHWATKILPVYDLVVAKGGPKMKLWSDADHRAHRDPGGMFLGFQRYTAWGNSSWRIASVLRAFLGREVIDKTGLTGQYDFDLTWTPWQTRASGMGSNSGSEANQGTGGGTASAPVSPGLSIFAAIQQQLGLRLKPAKGPVRVLVVDHVEPPTPN